MWPASARTDCLGFARSQICTWPCVPPAARSEPSRAKVIEKTAPSIGPRASRVFPVSVSIRRTPLLARDRPTARVLPSGDSAADAAGSASEHSLKLFAFLMGQMRTSWSHPTAKARAPSGSGRRARTADLRVVNSHFLLQCEVEAAISLPFVSPARTREE